MNDDDAAPPPDWCLTWEGFDPAQEGLREALCTLGNGFVALRAAAPESRADGVHYPATYLAGGYDRNVTPVAGREVENEDLVNFPHALALDWRVADGDWFGAGGLERLEHRQTLELRAGLLRRSMRCRDAAGRIVRVEQRVLVHIGQPHLAALQMTITPENGAATIGFASRLDGNARNAGVARYRDFDDRHLDVLEATVDDDETLFARVRTRQSRLELALAARTRAWRGDEPLALVPRRVVDEGLAKLAFEVAAEAGQLLRIEKIVALYSSRDAAISECGLAAREAVAHAGSFDALQRSQAVEWRHLWQRFDVGDVEIDGANAVATRRVLRLHAFHLLQTVSMHTIDLDAGVPARGWHGEAYRGHIFWDELFIFPLLNLRWPEVTRALLLYRWRRLDAARANARACGLRGALYPWQSGSSGREESQRVHLNPMSGRWVADDTWLQRHVNAAIAFNLWSYWQVTRDVEFMAFHGAEMMLEIARLMASLVSYDAASDRYEIHGVVGPDEFHTALPGAERPGLSNHTYTNLMAVWVLARALELLELLPEERSAELAERIGLGDDERAQWDAISRRMRVVFLPDGIPAAFEGWDGLQELDWDAYRARHGDIHRLDRILEAEGDSVNRYKAGKQADVLMLMYLFSAEELAELFGRLGYDFDPALIPRTVTYYTARTTHGSTLSRVVDAWVLARADRRHSWEQLQLALRSDVDDVQGGTTAEGIHLGAMAGTVDVLQRGYTGIETRGDTLWLNPCLPEEVRRLRLLVRYRGHAIELEIGPGTLEIHARDHARAFTAAPVRVGVRDEIFMLAAGQRRAFELPAGPAPCAQDDPGRMG